MSLIADYMQRAMAFLRRERDRELQWRLDRHDEEARLRHAQALAEQARVAELRKRAQVLAHELAMNDARQQTELEMVKIQCRQDLQDYQQYLQSLDKLKTSLRQSYAHLPEAMAFTIHHHAKQLLNRMWEETDEREKIRLEVALLRFMTAVHEDSQTMLSGVNDNSVPARALALLNVDDYSESHGRGDA